MKLSLVIWSTRRIGLVSLRFGFLLIKGDLVEVKTRVIKDDLVEINAGLADIVEHKLLFSFECDPIAVAVDLKPVIVGDVADVWVILEIGLPGPPLSNEHHDMLEPSCRHWPGSIRISQLDPVVAGHVWHPGEG
jgi:hypothetical protein